MFDPAKLIEQAAKTDYKTIVQEPTVGTPQTNEFLVFLKPEIFMGDQSHQLKRVTMIENKLKEFDVSVDGTIVVSGGFILEKGIMAKHYGFINAVSSTASQMVTVADRVKMTELLGQDCSKIAIYGGHEALKQFPDMTPKKLDDFWFTKKSLKVKSGLYFQKYTYAGQDFLLVDGFHPHQLEYFTLPDRRVVLLVCHSKTEWKKLRWDMIGSTFPEKAATGSIRGELYARAREFGYEKVDIANNGVHFSVGPFEGIIELDNFLGKALGKDIFANLSFVKLMLKEGLSMDQIKKSITNPSVTIEGKEKDLYGATEDMNPLEALQVYRGSL
ncbi:MAG: hypothetical protein WCO78_02435 [Candidatus Roizmanbacteria bacterium]